MAGQLIYRTDVDLPYPPFLALAHGLNGLRLIIDDYVRAPGRRTATKALLYTVSGLLFAYGTLTIVTFRA